MSTHDIYLVPGFLGFVNLGRITYFGHVRRVLEERFTALGLSARIHIVRTPPTASLPTRAARLAETIDKTAHRGAALHLVGHSSGGLDVRLFTAPGALLPTAVDVERLAARVRTVVTISTPHHGTPLASFFTTLRGQQLLQILSLNTIYALHFGHLPISALLWMGGMVLRYGNLVVNSELLDELFSRLLEDFSVGRRRAVRALLRDVVRDQALMLQLTPEAMEVFNASVLARNSVHYGAVVTQAARPSFRATLAAGLDPAAHVTHAVYSALHQLIAAAPGRQAPGTHARAEAGAETHLRVDTVRGRERRHRADALPDVGPRDPRRVRRPPRCARALPGPGARPAPRRLADVGERLRPRALRGAHGRRRPLRRGSCILAPTAPKRAPQAYREAIGRSALSDLHRLRSGLGIGGGFPGDPLANRLPTVSGMLAG